MMDDEMETDPLHLKYKPMKVCGICGDKALGYNFNAITCEACKAFFRRNALRNKDFKCPFDGNCKIDLVTRRFCQKCRLKKCFDIGMKKEWILSEDEKKVKRDKILENRRKKDVPGSDYGHHSNSCDNSMSGIKSPSSVNGDILNSNYHMSSYQENKDLLNSLYLLEHHKYQNLYLSSKLFPNKGTFAKDYANTYSNSIPGKSLYSHESLNSKSAPSSLRAPSSLINYGHSLWPSAENNLQSKQSKPVNSFNSFTENHHHFFKPHTKQESSNGHANYPMPYNPEHPFMNLNKSELDLIQLGCNRASNDQASSVISSDESETTTVYSSYNSDIKNIEDISVMESPVVPSTSSIDPQSKAFSAAHFAKDHDPNDYTSSDSDRFTAHHASLNSGTHLPHGPKTEADSNPTNSCFLNVKTEEDMAYFTDGLFELGKPRPQLLPLVPPNSYNFIETLRMEEISSACDTMKSWYQSGSVLKEMDNLSEMYQVAELVIKHLIIMARMISTFNELCEADQISLLKASVTEMIILRSIPCYIPEKDAWVFNISETRDQVTLLKFNTYKKTIPNGEFTEDVRHFMLAFPDECKRDIVLFDLLTMMILFTPNRSDLKHNEIIKLEHITYRHLLQKYIDLNYLSSKSSNKVFFTTLIDRIEDLHKINGKITQIYPSKVVDKFKANNFGHL